MLVILFYVADIKYAALVTKLDVTFPKYDVTKMFRDEQSKELAKKCADMLDLDVDSVLFNINYGPYDSLSTERNILGMIILIGSDITPRKNL